VILQTKDTIADYKKILKDMDSIAKKSNTEIGELKQKL